MAIAAEAAISKEASSASSAAKGVVLIHGYVANVGKGSGSAKGHGVNKGAAAAIAAVSAAPKAGAGASRAADALVKVESGIGKVQCCIGLRYGASLSHAAIAPVDAVAAIASYGLVIHKRTVADRGNRSHARDADRPAGALAGVAAVAGNTARSIAANGMVAGECTVRNRKHGAGGTAHQAFGGREYGPAIAGWSSGGRGRAGIAV